MSGSICGGPAYRVRRPHNYTTRCSTSAGRSCTRPQCQTYVLSADGLCVQLAPCTCHDANTSVVHGQRFGCVYVTGTTSPPDWNDSPTYAAESTSMGEETIRAGSDGQHRIVSRSNTLAEESNTIAGIMDVRRQCRCATTSLFRLTAMNRTTHPRQHTAHRSGRNHSLLTAGSSSTTVTWPCCTGRDASGVDHKQDLERVCSSAGRLKESVYLQERSVTTRYEVLTCRIRWHHNKISKSSIRSCNG